MCGIAGIIWKNKTSINKELFRSAADLMKHRGPDHTGYFTDEKVDLVHHRLSILDMDPRSHQPFYSSNKQQVLIYNGEIYNYRSLQKKYGVQLETTSDTELLHKLLLDKGDSVLPEFNGIFAYAHYDKEKQTVNLVRDRFGVKPLYYYENNDVFIFASEGKVILNFLDQFSINFQALSEFLWFGSSISTQTLVNGMQKLEPGNSLEINLKDFSKTKKSFWSIEKDILPVKNNDTYEQALKKTKDLFEKAVERQCLSDVPVGAYLSGGIDSSAVVAMASKHTKGKLNTYSVDFSGGRGSELPEAKRIAKKYGTNHHEFQVETKNLEEDIEAIILQYDEPFADPAALPLHLMAKQCSSETKVVLQGDGGDEVFAGYGRHLDLSELKIRQLGAKVLSHFHPKEKIRSSMKKRATILNQTSDAHRMALLVASGEPPEINRLFKGEWQSKINNSNPFLSYEIENARFSQLDYMQRMLYTDMKVILPNTFLEKVDKINMFHSIEARVPFLDNELVSYVMSLPQNYKIRNRTTKNFLREILRDELPNDILYAQKKSFGTPMGEWLRTSLYDYVINKFKKAEKNYKFLNVEYLLSKLEDHKTRKSDQSGLLWRTTVLITWLDFYGEKLTNKN
jgi:asparagine synthase (glutamine-hydrolysing)